MEHGLELIKKGVIWRIGNGEKINIWRDNWIRRDDALKITGRKKWTRLKKVKDLFGQGPNGWNDELIHSLFHQNDAEEILKIKLASHNLEDTIVEYIGNCLIKLIKL